MSSYSKRKRDQDRNHTVSNNAMSTHTVNKMMLNAKYRMSRGKQPTKLQKVLLKEAMDKKIAELNAEKGKTLDDFTLLDVEAKPETDADRATETELKEFLENPDNLSRAGAEHLASQVEKAVDDKIVEGLVGKDSGDNNTNSTVTGV